MSFLPIINRELQASARRQATYRDRALTAGVAVLVGGGFLLFESGTGIRTPGIIRGKTTFDALCLVALVFCCAEALWRTADCISSEKREGTLGLLFLTDLKSREIVLGKFLSAWLPSVYTLLAILPVLGLPLLIGGVTSADFWLSALALLVLHFFSLALGLLASSVFWSKRTAMLATGAALCVVNLAPLLLPIPAIKILSPILLMGSAAGGFAFLPPVSYAASIVATGLMGLLAFAGASAALPRFWQEGRRRDSSPAAGYRISLQSRVRREKARREQLLANPIIWLVGRQSTRLLWLWLLPAAGITTATFLMASPRWSIPPVIVACWVLNLFVLAALAARAPRCLNEARHLGVLEAVLSTPLTNDDILCGHRRALVRTFLPVMAAILGIEYVALAPIGNWNSAPVCFAFCFSLYFILQPFAIINVGMWYGLQTQNARVAAAKTILYALVIPTVCVPLCNAAFPILLAASLVWTVHTGRKLRDCLRVRAVEPYE